MRCITCGENPTFRGSSFCPRCQPEALVSAILAQVREETLLRLDMLYARERAADDAFLSGTLALLVVLRHIRTYPSLWGEWAGAHIWMGSLEVAANRIGAMAAVVFEGEKTHE